MSRRILFQLFTLSILSQFWETTCWAADTLVVQPDHADGVYHAGETITWNVTVDPSVGPVTELSYDLKQGGLTSIGTGTVPVAGGKATITSSLSDFGTILVEVTGKTGDTALAGAGGAVVDPEKLLPGVKCPDEFDTFWQSEVQALEAIPMNAVVTSEPSGKDGVDYAKVTLDNINGTHVQAQVARPQAGGKYPAIVLFQFAGVYPLKKELVTKYAAQGWLALDINAHDLPLDQPEQFYKDLLEGSLKGYPMIGSESRETSYFLRMFLGCRRAVEYIASRPDWNGRVLVVRGTSQGGLQSFVAAALDDKVTAVIVEVPAGLDAGANKAGRAFGFPYWAREHSDKVMETSQYYDGAYFAARTKCPVLVGAGLIDITSPIGGVYAGFNQIQGPKELVIFPQGTHHDHHEGMYPREKTWLNALLAGQPAPVAHNSHPPAETSQ